MIGALWTGLFGFMQALDPVYDDVEHEGMLVQVPIWPITQDEAQRLGDATAAQLRVLPQKKKLAKLINKYAPTIALCATIASVAGPRASFSLEMKKKAKLYAQRPMAAQQQPRYAPPGAAPQQSGGAEGPGNGVAPGVSPEPATSAKPDGSGEIGRAARNGVAAHFDAAA
jgi:hypothetical protein